MPLSSEPTGPQAQKVGALSEDFVSNLSSKGFEPTQGVVQGDAYFGTGGYSFTRASDGIKLNFSPMYNFQGTGETRLQSAYLMKDEEVVASMPEGEYWTFEQLESWDQLNQ